MARETVLITGGSSDIGLALIRSLVASEEPPVVLVHCNSSKTRVEELRDQIGYTDIYPLLADFSFAPATEELAKQIKAEYGSPHRFIHLPGLKLRYERFTKFDWAHFETDLNVQVRSAVILLKALLPGMTKLPSASVVFLLSSVTRGVPPKFMSMYSIVKQAQLGLMRSLAAEYAGTSVNVNAVSPGMIETRFLDELPGMIKEATAAAAPSRRIAQPSDVIAAIEFLLSPKAAYITGIELPVTGGSGN